MKKLFARTLWMGALILLSYAVLWLIPVRPSTIYSAILDKRALLARTPAPRVIFIGGSGIALGLDSELVEGRMSEHVINMGVNAGFGLRYILDEVRPSIQPGDLVVVTPEYEDFFGKGLEGDENLLWALQIGGLDWNSDSYLSAGRWRTIATELPFFMQSRVMEMLSRRSDPVYNRAAFNERGDFVNHLDLPPSPIHPTRIAGEQSPSEEAFVVLDAFVESVRKAGADAVILPPAVAEVYYRYEDNRAKIRAIIDRVSAETPIRLIARPEEFVLPTEDFFDTAYHLNRRGRRVRSEKVAEALSDYRRQTARALRSETLPLAGAR